MASDRKIESCKANGSKAAGSKTPEGIDRSKMNALKHGLTAQTLMLPGESQEMFDEFAESVRSSLNPRTPVQQILVHNVVTAAWRQRRLIGYETSALILAEEEMRDEVDKKWIEPSPQSRSTLAFQTLMKAGQINIMTRYDSHLDHQLHRAIRALQNQPIKPRRGISPNDANPTNEHQQQPDQEQEYDPNQDLPAFLAETKVAAAGSTGERTTDGRQTRDATDGPQANSSLATHHSPLVSDSPLPPWYNSLRLPLALLMFLSAPLSALRLETARDQSAFRHWFTFLAEAQFFNAPQNRPAEITDCSALIRYAYRDALRNHDPQWAASAGLPIVLPFESVAQYTYPHTPTGPAIFANADGKFSQFADARSLREHNTHFISKRIDDARPGDLLFYRNTAAQHSMIFIGRSYVSHDNANYVVYHTGPEGNDPGEIRRRDTQELIRHPDPQWRPIPSNPNFLGVYRWNIL